MEGDTSDTKPGRFIQGKPGHLGTSLRSPCPTSGFRSPGLGKKHSGVTPIKRYRGPHRSTFKSPVLAANQPVPESTACVASLGDEIQKLKNDCQRVTAEVAELEKIYSVSELQLYIDLFHEYNEVKDTTQMVLGRMAEIRGTTVRQLHEEYGVDAAD